MNILRTMTTWTVFFGLAFAAANTVLAQGRSGSSQGQSQVGGNPIGDLPQPTLQTLGSGADDTLRTRTAKMEHDQERARNSDRQKKLVEDTERLLSLASELKVDVDKTDKDTLSLDVIKKADEIEKLAKSVKDRMKGQS